MPGEDAGAGCCRLAQPPQDVLRVVFLDQQGVLGLQGRRLEGGGLRGVGRLTRLVDQLEGLGTVVFLAGGLSGLIEVVHVFLVGLGLLVALAQQEGQRLVGPRLVSHLTTI